MASKKVSLLFIFITILVDVIGVGIIIPVIPTLIENLTGEELNIAAGYGGFLIMAYAGMQFFFAPVLGELSDKFGRRPILLMSLLGLGLDYILHAYAPTIAWLFVGRILAGITGASYSVANAYIADISDPSEKAKNFGYIGVAFGLGFIIGPLIGGVFAEISVQMPFLVAAGLTLLNFLFGLFFVPESLPKDKRRPVQTKKMIPGASLVHLGSYPALLGLIIAFFLASMAGQALPSTWNFFTMEMYDWSEAQVGYSLAVVGLLVAAVQGGLIGVVVKKFGEYKTIMAGFVLWTLGMMLFAFSYTPALLYSMLPIYVLGGVAGPTLQGLLSNKVPNTEQGNLQGALTSLVSVAAIVGPLIATGSFYFFSGSDAPVYFPGAPYIAGALLLCASSVFAYRSLKKLRLMDTES